MGCEKGCYVQSVHTGKWANQGIQTAWYSKETTFVIKINDDKDYNISHSTFPSLLEVFVCNIDYGCWLFLI